MTYKNQLKMVYYKQKVTIKQIMCFGLCLFFRICRENLL